MRKVIIPFFVAAFAVAIFPIMAHASLILIGSGSGNDSAAQLQSYLGMDYEYTLFDKDLGDESDGFYYEDQFSATPTSYNDVGEVLSAALSWDFSGMDAYLRYVLVKADGGYNIYEVSTDQWVTSGGEQIILTYNGAGISHVSAYGVPEPTTMLLLGIGLVGLAGRGVRRRIGQKFRR